MTAVEFKYVRAWLHASLYALLYLSATEQYTFVLLPFMARHIATMLNLHGHCLF
jgi:hypothetical protein